MTVPSGDLAPRRKSARYARPHQSHWGRRILALLVVLALAGGGAYYWRHRHHGKDTVTAARASCRPTSPARSKASTAVRFPAPPARCASSR